MAADEKAVDLTFSGGGELISNASNTYLFVYVVGWFLYCHDFLPARGAAQRGVIKLMVWYVHWRSRSKCSLNTFYRLVHVLVLEQIFFS